MPWPGYGAPTHHRKVASWPIYGAKRTNSKRLIAPQDRRRTVTGHPRGRLKLLCAIAMLALVALVDLLSYVARRQLAR